MNMERRGICVAGSLIADHFYEVDSYPKEGFLSTIRSSSMHVGGSGNLILDLAKLDENLTVKVCAVVGEDQSGKELLDVVRDRPDRLPGEQDDQHKDQKQARA